MERKEEDFNRSVEDVNASKASEEELKKRLENVEAKIEQANKDGDAAAAAELQTERLKLLKQSEALEKELKELKDLEAAIRYIEGEVSLLKQAAEAAKQAGAESQAAELQAKILKQH